MGIIKYFGRIFGKNKAEGGRGGLDARLLAAAAEGNLGKVKKLIKAGANINAKDPDGYTVLMNANLCGNNEVAEELIDAGADLSATDNNDRTESSYATREIRELIEKKMRRAGGRTKEEARNEKVVMISALDDMLWSDAALAKLNLAKENRWLVEIFLKDRDPDAGFLEICGGYYGYMRVKTDSFYFTECVDDLGFIMALDMRKPSLFKFPDIDIFIFKGAYEGQATLHLIAGEESMKRKFPEVLKRLEKVFFKRSSIKDLAFAYSKYEPGFEEKYKD